MKAFWLILIVYHVSAQNLDTKLYDPAKEPFKTLIKEAKYMAEFMDFFIVNGEEQSLIPYTIDPVLTIKLVLRGFNFTDVLDPNDPNIIMMENETLSSNEDIDTELLFKDGTISVLSNYMDVNVESLYNAIQIMRISAFGLQPLIYAIISPEAGNLTVMAAHLRRHFSKYESYGDLEFTHAMAQVYKRVDKTTVYELVFQLYQVKFLQGMNDPDNLIRRNTTDQIMHLVKTKFTTIFGEAFYRAVVMDFYPSASSVIARVSVLLDPHPDNYYHSTNVWFSIDGFITLGIFPIMPDNVYVIESSMTMEEFYPYLSDRSYKRPLTSKTDDELLMDVTIPSLAGIIFGIIFITCILKYFHLLVFKVIKEEEEKKSELKFFNLDKSEQE